MNNRVPFFGLSVFLLMSIASTWAYDVETHKAVGEKATDVSSVDGVLKTELGFAKGKDTLFSNKSAKEWIGDGARFEDSPPTRLLNHFHNPLRPWDQAGLRFGFQLGQSSVLWQQNTNQNFSSVFIPVPFPPFFLPSFSFGGNWSWQDARQRYLEALTGSRGTTLLTKQEREQAFADTFRALGQLSHIIQDASVPAHVRNDRHPPVLNPDWYEDWIQETRQTNSSLFQGLLNLFDKDRHRPSFSIFTPTGNSQAPVPIARLMDTDKFLGLNFSVLTDPGLGITEYTNGNFLSRDTIFKDFDLPRQSSLEPDFFVEPFGAKFRRYLRKTSEGESPIDHFVTESLLHESIKDALGAGPLPAAAWYLDDRVHEDYARLLLPRAVGYSAGLLDYFFRGKLDVDLVPDPNSSDPTVVKLSGTNGSEDKLDGGTLTLHADDPITGERSPVPALDPNLAVTADPGQPVESAKFQINAEAERFMAVYKGKLGNEVPQGNSPGGVIGKVLGGVRAESIYADGDKRKLRTVDGVFSLPPTTDKLVNVAWGDQDNVFVGTLSNSGNPNSPDQILAFKINRPVGSSDKPPLIDMPGGTKAVSVDVLKAVNFPFDLSLDVTVNFSQTIRFQQFLLTYTVIDTLVWNGSFYALSSRDIQGPTEAETVIDQTFTFRQEFPIILDQAHRPGGSAFTPYGWGVQEVTFDQQGRLLVVVSASLTRPDDNRRRLNLRRRNPQCQLVEDPLLPQDIFAGLFISDPILAIIDIEQKKVLGVTAASAYLPSSQNATAVTLLQQHLIQTFVGGPSAGLTQEICSNALFLSPNPSYATIETATISTPPAGLLSLQLPGRFRTDIDTLASEPFTVSAVQRESQLIYYVDNVTRTNRAVRSVRFPSGVEGTFTFSPQAKLIRPTSGVSPELFLLIPHRECHSEGCFIDKSAALVRWSPDSPTSTALAVSEEPPPSHFYILAYATASAALIEFEDLQISWLSTWIVNLTSKQLRTIRGTPGIVVSREYVFLDPQFLYNINDTRFHTLDASLRPTVLPRPLASAPTIRPPSAAYHLIYLR